jgi:hypothetical protein
MKKSIKKTVKKAPKLDMIINCVGCETESDVYDAYIDAKARAGKQITTEDLKFVRDNANIFVDVYNFYEIKCKKTPWYKRFWNWLLRK